MFECTRRKNIWSTHFLKCIMFLFDIIWLPRIKKNLPDTQVPHARSSFHNSIRTRCWEPTANLTVFRMNIIWEIFAKSARLALDLTEQSRGRRNQRRHRDYMLNRDNSMRGSMILSARVISVSRETKVQSSGEARSTSLLGAVSAVATLHRRCIDYTVLSWEKNQLRPSQFFFIRHNASYRYVTTLIIPR